MPKGSRRISPIVIEKTAKDGKKLRKMSSEVQIWTRLENLKFGNLSGIKRRVEALISRFVAQAATLCTFPRNLLCVFQWPSIRKN
jgi:hypothetical protein